MYTFLAIASILSVSRAIVSGLFIPEPLVRRDWCDTLTMFSESDVRALQDSLRNADNATGDLRYLEAHSYLSWDWGTARVCVWNDYWFENTHISLWEAGWAVGYINGICCTGGDESECTGGSTTAHGDSGLPLRVVLKSSTDSCR